MKRVMCKGQIRFDQYKSLNTISRTSRCLDISLRFLCSDQFPSELAEIMPICVTRRINSQSDLADLTLTSSQMKIMRKSFCIITRRIISMSLE